MRRLLQFPLLPQLWQQVAAAVATAAAVAATATAAVATAVVAAVTVVTGSAEMARVLV